MRVVVIGGTGHIGTYLSPLLTDVGHEVVSVTRGTSRPYQENAAWTRISSVVMDRLAEEESGTFGERIAGLEGDAVIDLTCYYLSSAQQLVEAIRGRVRHFLHCGTIWVHGPSVEVPTQEDAVRTAFGDYGCRKLAIEQYLVEQSQNGFPATIVHPGHLVGPGWAPINPAGNFDLEVFEALSSGREITLPNLGMETLHHVHAGDVAGLFASALRTAKSIGESFHAVSPAALTMRGYAERVAAWFGQKARLRFVPWEEWQASVPERDARITLDHMRHSPNCSMQKAKRLLGFVPKYSSLAAIEQAVRWLTEQGRLSGRLISDLPL